LQIKKKALKNHKTAKQQQQQKAPVTCGLVGEFGQFIHFN
jgi:hypothetical protein